MSAVTQAVAEPPVSSQGTPSLRVTEIFASLQGETSRVGLPTVFVRLTGCPLRCGYCDTAYAFHGGETRPLDDIMRRVAEYGVQHVTLTGGEPLAQKHAPLLLRQLADAGYSVSLETSGAIDVAPVDTRVSRILDIKTPGSCECERNLWSNLGHLTPHDEIKFVICDEADYLWSREQLRSRRLNALCPVLFSPVHGRFDPRLLADWILRDKLPVRMQVQLHKLLWGDQPGH